MQNSIKNRCSFDMALWNIYDDLEQFMYQKEWGPYWTSAAHVFGMYFSVVNSYHCDGEMDECFSWGKLRKDSPRATTVGSTLIDSCVNLDEETGEVRGDKTTKELMLEFSSKIQEYAPEGFEIVLATSHKRHQGKVFTEYFFYIAKKDD